MRAKQLVQVFLLANALLATGCATVGSKLDLQLAQEAETKGCEETDQGKGISLEDCKLISEVIKAMTTDATTGKFGFVGYDSDGKIKLKGSYKDEEAIARAFMVAATVVGVDKVGVSDVTPRELGKIKMTKSYVTPKDTGGKPKKYALLIGVSIFQDTKISPIETAGKDADLLADILEGKNGFENENITVIKDEDATKANILAAMRDLASKVTSKDAVVFYISTHGTPPSHYGKTGIVPFDMKKPNIDWSRVDTTELGSGTGGVTKDRNIKVTNQDIISIAKSRSEAIESAISFDDLQNFMASIKTDKFIAILDTCFSGSALEALTKPVKPEYAEATKSSVVNYSDSHRKALIDATAQSCNASDYETSQVKAALNEAFNNYKSKHPNIKYPKTNLSSKSLFVSDKDIESSNQGVNKAIDKKIEKNQDYNFEQLERLKAAFSSDKYEMQQGRILITATTGNEESLFDKDVPEIPNSFFTYYLANGLEKYHGQTFKAFDYAQLRTQLLVQRDYAINHGRKVTQTPQMTSTPAACANINLSK